MDWTTYYDKFYDWEESTQLRHLSSLTSFGPSSEVCELACAFFEEKSANRLIKKALAAGVKFTADEVLELDGVIDQNMMPQLIKNTSHTLSAEHLDDFVFWLTKEEIRVLAQNNHLRLDEDGNVMTADMIEAELEALEVEKEIELEQKELERIEAEEASLAEEQLLIAKFILAMRSKRRRERCKRRQEGR